MVTGPSASSAPATMGSVAFLAPEMRTSPSRGMPPLICSLSTEGPGGEGPASLKAGGATLQLRAPRGAAPRTPVSAPGRRGSLVRRQRFDRERMDLPSDQLTERLINELMA